MLNLIVKKRIPFLVADIILIALSIVAAFLVRFELAIPARYTQNIEGIMALAVLITIPLFSFFKLYSFSWAYVSTEELWSLIKATTLSFLILAASFFVLRDHPLFSGFPRSTLFISYFFIFASTGGIRFIKRIYLQVFSGRHPERKERTLIVGAGGAGEQILRNILNSKSSPYLPVGFIDDNLARQDLLIHGLKVLGSIDEIPKIAKEENIDSLLIAFPSAGASIIKRAEEKGIEGGIVDIKYLPPMDEMINGADKVGLEDLLERETAALDEENEKSVRQLVQNKRILVTGGAGSIGSELCRQIAKFSPASLTVLDQDETGIFNITAELKRSWPDLKIFSVIADIREKNKLDSIFKKYSPQIIFHAAAYKHVPLMEENADEAVKNNIFGTKNLIAAASGSYAEKFVFISTDKAVNPTSVMGATKRIGEMMCQAANKSSTKFISVRFGNVLGSRGSVIPIFREQISRGGPVTITHKDMKRYFMVTSEACLLVLQSGAMGQGGEVFVLDMGDPVKIIDLAKKLISSLGFDGGDVKIDYVSPRPGEKLEEELLTAEEGAAATKNEKILTAKLPPTDEGKLGCELDRLEKEIDGINFSDKEIKETLAKIVPNYSFTN